MRSNCICGDGNSGNRSLSMAFIVWRNSFTGICHGDSAHSSDKMGGTEEEKGNGEGNYTIRKSTMVVTEHIKKCNPPMNFENAFLFFVCFSAICGLLIAKHVGLIHSRLAISTGILNPQ